MNIGIVIKGLRKQKGLSQDELGEALGISQTYLSQIESEKKVPAAATVAKVATFFEIPSGVLAWMSIEEKDVPEHKKEAYRLMKPAVDELIKSTFN